MKIQTYSWSVAGLCSLFAATALANEAVLSVYFPDYPNQQPWILCQPGNRPGNEPLFDGIVAIDPTRETCETHGHRRYTPEFEWYPLYVNLADEQHVPGIRFHGEERGSKMLFPVARKDLPFTMRAPGPGLAVTYWMVKRGGRRIDPALWSFLPGDTLEFMGHALREDHTIRMRNFGDGNFRLNRGPAAPDNIRVELRYTRNCLLRCCKQLGMCIGDLLFNVRQVSQNWAAMRRANQVPAPNPDEIVIGNRIGGPGDQDDLLEAFNNVALAADLDLMADDQDSEAEDTRGSPGEVDENEHDPLLWDQILQKSPEDPQEVFENIDFREDEVRDRAWSNDNIELVPLPRIEEEDDNQEDDEAYQHMNNAFADLEGLNHSFR
ncbi:hypothetical protein TWF694_007648 [Orbilia ellipsospora]|uniref:Uncharacterized protein n=1 Tax=Orbilia ellipsospora TaxID=2528407 RepID=A0AAV9XIC2_9PEZI